MPKGCWKGGRKCRLDDEKQEVEVTAQDLADAALVAAFDGAEAAPALPDGLFAEGGAELLEAEADELLLAEVVYTSDKEM
eukprot:tig00020912_g15867.t1